MSINISKELNGRPHWQQWGRLSVKFGETLTFSNDGNPEPILCLDLKENIFEF